NLIVDASGGLKKLPLSFATWQQIAADHSEGVVFRAEAPLAPLGFNLRADEGLETLGVDAAVDDANLSAIAHQWRAAAPFWLRRIRLVSSFAQHFRHELRHRDECV